MSEQPLSTNPEYLFHYEHLRRDRALMRRQGYVLLIVAGMLLAGATLLASTTSLSRSGILLAFLLFIAFSLLLFCNGLLALKQSRQPINDTEVARRRQEERRQLFQFAQGHISWRYWLSVAIQLLIGIIFLLLGIQALWSLVTHLSSLDLVDAILSFAFVLVGWYSLFRAIRSARQLRRLAKMSNQELAARLRLGETTEGE